MKILELKEATASLAEYTRRVSEESVVVTKDGKPVAALVSIENADWETVKLSTNYEFLTLIQRARAEQQSKGGISSDEIRDILEELP